MGRRQGIASTKAWSNTRDAGNLLGRTARLHPELRSCIDALGLEEGRGAWVSDALVIRSSANDPVPLWGHLMRDETPGLRLALIGWALGVDLRTIRHQPIGWEELLASEQVRSHVVHGGKERDDKKGLARELDALQQRAMDANPPDPDPRGGVAGQEWGRPEDDWLADKYGLDPLIDAPRTGLAPGLLSQGWHLVAPLPVLGWMVAQHVLGDARSTARELGLRHLGLGRGFRSADRARYFMRLCGQHRDLATFTLQHNIIWALAELGVIPETATDAGVPLQTMLVGQHQQKDCCLLVSGDHLRLWYRSGGHWSREPLFVERLPENFLMAVVGDDEVTMKGTRSGECPFPVTVTQLQLHTFPGTPSTFPVSAWARRTGLNPASVIPLSSFDLAGRVGR